jgi:hypothetical protein
MLIRGFDVVTGRRLQRNKYQAEFKAFFTISIYEHPDSVITKLLSTSS